MQDRKLTSPLAYRDDDAPGRPWIITKDGREQVRAWRSNGVAQADIANQLGISPRSFRDLLDRDDDLKDAYSVGTDQMESELVGLLMSQAREGNLSAQIFALKALCRKREVGEAPGSKAQSAPAVNITIPAALSPSDLQALTDQMKIVSSDVDEEPIKSKRLIK